MSTAELEVRDDGAVRWIALNRPESKNGLTDEINGAIIDAVNAVGADPKLRCVVITGKGGSFCSGLDLKAAAAMMGAGDADPQEHLEKYFHGLIRSIRNLDKPVIALVDGAAAGFGCDLALACDFRIGTERTRMGEVFVKRGLMPDGGGTYHLARLVGLGRAMEMLLTGEMVGAEDCARWGLVNRLVPSAEAEGVVAALARTVAAGPPLVHQRVKRAVYAAQDGTLDEALKTEARGQLELLRSADFLEGVSAFFQKRPAEFKGK